MLHELLLGLSGHPSPLLCTPRSPLPDGEVSDPTGAHSRLRSAFSDAELALLSSLATDLGERHHLTRQHATSILQSHPSNACQAVAAAIINKHLADFQSKILHLEHQILEGNSAIVGAEGIVPLSAILGGLDGWGRRLEWMLDLVNFMREPEERNVKCTAAVLIDRLRRRSRTGFPDLREICQNLNEVAEAAWMKQLASWVLYGRHPGAEDFMVRKTEDSQESERHRLENYEVVVSLVPGFVTSDTTESILFVGKSLHHVRERRSSIGSHTQSAWPSTSPELALLRSHLHLLSELKIPINANDLTNVIGAIRLSLSQNALQSLLPMSNVLETLAIFRDYFLLESGEFAMSLITAAEGRLNHRQTGRGRKARTNLVDDLSSLTINDGEIQAVLARTWTAIASQRGHDDEETDEKLDRARSLIRLSIKLASPPDQLHLRNASLPTFDDLLLPLPTVLTLRLVPPLDLFLVAEDVFLYSSMHAYLLSIRRASIRLSDLYRLSDLRRENSNHRKSSSGLPSAQNSKSLRSIWSGVTIANSFFSELGSYIHDEVISNSWQGLHTFLIPSTASRPSTSSSAASSTTKATLCAGTDKNLSQKHQNHHDPHTLAEAHRSYIDALRYSLLIPNITFTAPLRRLMGAVEHVVALMRRLETVNQTQNATTIPGSEAAPRFGEIERLIGELKVAVSALEEGVEICKAVLRKLGDSDDNTNTGPTAPGTKPTKAGFTPWVAGRRGLERLISRF